WQEIIRQDPWKSKDPITKMYQRAAKVAADIINRSEELQRAEAIKDIREKGKAAIDSGTVEARYKGVIGNILARTGALGEKAQEGLRKLVNATRQRITADTLAGKGNPTVNEFFGAVEGMAAESLKTMPLDRLLSIRNLINSLRDVGKYD